MLFAIPQFQWNKWERALRATTLLFYNKSTPLSSEPFGPFSIYLIEIEKFKNSHRDSDENYVVFYETEKVLLPESLSMWKEPQEIVVKIAWS